MPDTVEVENVRLTKEIWHSGFWAPVAVFLAHVILSLDFNAYERLPVVDLPIHLLGGMAIGFFFSRVLDILGDHAIVDTIDGLLRAILLVALTATAAVWWEFAEYVSDHVFGTHAQGGLEDTLLDMFVGILGGVTIAAFLFVKNGHRKTLYK